MGEALNGLFGLKNILVNGVERVFRQTFNFIGDGWTIAEGVDDKGRKTVEISFAGGEGGAAVQLAPVSLVYHEATSGSFVRLVDVPVSGIEPGATAWCSPSGPTDAGGVFGGVVACYVTASGLVEIIGELFSTGSIPSTVSQPAIVFWIPGS